MFSTAIILKLTAYGEKLVYPRDTVLLFSQCSPTAVHNRPPFPSSTLDLSQACSASHPLSAKSPTRVTLVRNVSNDNIYSPAPS